MNLAAVLLISSLTSELSIMGLMIFSLLMFSRAICIIRDCHVFVLTDANEPAEQLLARAC